MWQKNIKLKLGIKYKSINIFQKKNPMSILTIQADNFVTARLEYSTLLFQSIINVTLYIKASI